MIKKSLVIMIAMLLAGIGIVAAQDDMTTPYVTVNDQVSVDGTVTIDEAFSPGPGWMVIHADNGEGAPGPVIGFRQLQTGMNVNFAVPVDTASATPTLFAMLHEDTGEAGVYEFGEVEGADLPVLVDEAPVTPPFNVELIGVTDQFIADGTVTVGSVVVSQDGFVVVHADNGEGAPGPVLGFAAITAGQNSDVAVTLDGEATNVLFPMLHVDTGEAGVYEFGTVEGADGPVAVDGVVAVTGITVGTPAMRVPDQIVTDTVTATSVLSDGPGWLVIHAESEEGGPGPVIGFAAVEDGINTDVTVEIDADAATPTLFPMLHVDTGEAGVYEFGEVEGADGPVTIDGNVLVFPINAAPSITYSGELSDNVLTIDSALIDAPGWMVVHADNGEGAPGPVLGFTPIIPGVNNDIMVELDADGITETLFPMLHYDTGEAGVYEFGTVEGADGPVAVNEAVITGPLVPGDMMDEDM
jgi:hypothetical protein